MSDSMSDHEIPLWVELAASKGAEKALAAHAPVMEKLTERVEDCEKSLIRLDATTRTIRWIGAGIVTIAGLILTFFDKLHWK